MFASTQSLVEVHNQTSSNQISGWYALPMMMSVKYIISQNTKFLYPDESYQSRRLSDLAEPASTSGENKMSTVQRLKDAAFRYIHYTVRSL